MFISISLGFGQISNKTDTVNVRPILIETDTVPRNAFDSTEFEYNKNIEGFSKVTLGESEYGEEKDTSFWKTYVFNPMRLGFSYEVAAKFKGPVGIKKNRFSTRLEYSKLLFNKISLQVDTKALIYMAKDHRTWNSTFWFNDDSSNVEMAFGGRTREAYLQTSFQDMSIKVGIQTLAWGESDFATITDEISPMDYREPLNLNLDELKTGQLMLTVDHYSQFGNLTGFFIPFPSFNKYPKKGSGYYYDPFKGYFHYQVAKQDGIFFEAGLRWKKTFGKSDISFMAASLINNDYATRVGAFNTIYQEKLRYSMAGITFNCAIDKFLLRGEVAFKSPKSYSDRSMQIVKKSNLDESIGIDYSASSTFTLSLEAVNYHIIDWDSRVKSASRDNYMLLFILSKQFMHNDLSVNLVTMYNGPYTGVFNLLSTTLNWNDHVSFSMDVIIPIANDSNGAFYLYRDQKQAALKFTYQF